MLCAPIARTSQQQAYGSRREEEQVFLLDIAHCEASPRMLL
jgi:hypothetical protein